MTLLGLAETYHRCYSFSLLPSDSFDGLENIHHSLCLALLQGVASCTVHSAPADCVTEDKPSKVNNIARAEKPLKQLY